MKHSDKKMDSQEQICIFFGKTICHPFEIQAVSLLFGIYQLEETVVSISWILSKWLKNFLEKNQTFQNDNFRLLKYGRPLLSLRSDSHPVFIKKYRTANFQGRRKI